MISNNSKKKWNYVLTHLGDSKVYKDNNQVQITLPLPFMQWIYY